MAVFKITPHLDEDAATVDVQFSQTLYSSWTDLILTDPVANYPRKFSDTRVTQDTYIRFRIKNTLGEYTDWSNPIRPLQTSKPDTPSNLCFVYSRLRDRNTQEPLNSVKVRCRAVGGTAASGVLDILDKTEETDDYGWFGIYLTPGKEYEVSCPEASLNKIIVVPNTRNAKLKDL